MGLIMRNYGHEPLSAGLFSRRLSLSAEAVDGGGEAPPEDAPMGPKGNDMTEIFNKSIYDPSDVPIRSDGGVEIPDATQGAQARDSSSVDDVISYDNIIAKYPGRVIKYDYTMQNNKTCSVFLCGTVHVTNASVAMVEDLCASLRPDVVLLELCPERIDACLCAEAGPKKPLSILEAVSDGIRGRSLQDVVLGLVTWVQERLSSALGATTGAEQAAAFLYAKKRKIPVVLGDRKHSITAQRISDRMTAREKVVSLCSLCWELISWPFVNSSEYIKRSESDAEFLTAEIKEFSESNKGLAEVLIAERDEYIAQSIIELIKVLNLRSCYGGGSDDENGAVVGDPAWPSSNSEVNVLAIMGLGHLQGVYRHICQGGASEARMRHISTSSKCAESTWPGEAHLQVVEYSSS